MSFDAALKRLTKASGGQGRGCEPGMTKVRINDLDQIIFQFLNLDNVMRTMEQKEREAQFKKWFDARNASTPEPTGTVAHALPQYGHSEEMIDSVRSLLLARDGGINTVGGTRRHVQGCGGDTSYWPGWALSADKEHLTKAGFATLLLATFDKQGQDRGDKAVFDYINQSNEAIAKGVLDNLKGMSNTTDLSHVQEIMEETIVVHKTSAVGMSEACMAQAEPIQERTSYWEDQLG